MDALQRIAAVCTIASFVAAIYTGFADGSEASAYGLFGLALLCLVVFLARGRRQRPKGRKAESAERGVVILRGRQDMPFPYDGVEIEVFYPRLFKRTPNLRVHVRKKRGAVPETGTGGTGRPRYEITDQAYDSFTIKIYSLPDVYAHAFEWQAKGERSPW